MSTPVTGPDDVKPGDIVNFIVDPSNTYRDVRALGVVVKATAARVVAKYLDESPLVLVVGAYTFKRKSSVFGRSSTSTHYRFQRLDAHDRWRRERPSVSVVVAVDGKSIVITYSTLAADLDGDIARDLAVMTEWLRREPAKDAP